MYEVHAMEIPETVEELDQLYADIERRDLARFPYEVYHPEGGGPPPKFRSWADALAAQKEWNREVSGHIARKRK
ncbi:hypothetical protein HBA55_35025 [Pseudomaricurvus alkylphenolicus]|uniref:hypothetical protein n=1 Tax=Pseudomaricurvus alkylphenolicus TaxID=1306991 RepID=UPI001421F1D9|nr:hypothetical protein [Pseudomaricurvus alkylphenolicus]NIB44847.1 hypothetical protein [Pseudomaricurvus alkylphenolicus]